MVLVFNFLLIYYIYYFDNFDISCPFNIYLAKKIMSTFLMGNIRKKNQIIIIAFNSTVFCETVLFILDREIVKCILFENKNSSQKKHHQLLGCFFRLRLTLLAINLTVNDKNLL